MGLKAKDGLVGSFVGFVHPITKKIESKPPNNMNHSFLSTSQVPTHVGGYGDVQSIEERKRHNTKFGVSFQQTPTTH